jgi:hypothetical protein
MKKLALAFVILVGMVVPAYAVNVSMSSTIQIANAPVNSKWQVECGPSTGVYNTTNQFTMSVVGVNTIPVYSIFSTVGTFFCRTTFAQAFGIGPYSTEVSVTVTAPTLSAPSLSIIP